LGRIGVTREEIRRRNLVFHCSRHTFNSYLRGKVPDEQLRRVPGHRSEAMADRYDHVQIECLADVLAVQKQLFSFRAQDALVAPSTPEPANAEGWRRILSSESAKGRERALVGRE